MNKKIKTNEYNINDVYTDLDLTLPIHPLTGDVKVAKGVKAISRSVKNLVFLAKWDIPFRPDIYGGVNELLFENINPIIIERAKTIITDLLDKYEPRIKVNFINVHVISNTQLHININYKIIATEAIIETNINLKRDR